MDEEVRKEGRPMDGLGFTKRTWVGISVVARYHSLRVMLRNLYVEGRVTRGDSVRV